MNIYVGNLSREVTEDELKQEFAAFGEVTSVNIIKDKYSGQSKGFGFVEMSTQAEAIQAKEALDGFNFEGRPLKVDEARPPRKKSSRGYRRY